MPLFCWEDRLMTRHEPMDRDHRTLVDLVNALGDAMDAGESKQVCLKALDALIDATRAHFTMEEALMATHGYAGMAEHKVMHDRLLKEVQLFHVRYEADDAPPNTYLLYFLRDWLCNHILTADKAFAATIAAKDAVESGH